MTTTLFGPLAVADSNLFDLSSNPSTPDDVELTPGLLKGYAGGLRALDGDDSVRGSADGEIVNGNEGKDILSGKDGNDFFLGGRSHDAVYGDDGDDTVNGNRGNDLVDGGLGNDLVRGGQDNDLLIGDRGNDTLIGDFGQDVLIGGLDKDVFVLRTDTATSNYLDSDLIVDFDKFNDVIGLTEGISETSLNFQEFSYFLGEVSEATLNKVFLLNGFVVDAERIKAAIAANLSPQDIDPNGDGIVEVTIVEANGNFLGMVLNAKAADLSGHFLSF